MKKPILGNNDFPKETENGEFRIENVDNTGNEQVYLASRPMYTGRYFMIFPENTDVTSAGKMFREAVGLHVAYRSDFSHEEYDESKIRDADVLMYDDISVALVGAEPEQIAILRNVASDYILVPEKIVYASQESVKTTTLATWGIEVTRTLNSSYTGKDIPVAILDTGLDFSHPDFNGRVIKGTSFVPGETMQGVHGHGTHCIGTACGRQDKNGVRYGVAMDSHIFSGKVLNNSGSGAEAWVLDGIRWATAQGCRVTSMSLGAKVLPGEGYNPAYEREAGIALSKGNILVAAAGNDSHRNMVHYAPVNSPANCPSIMAVAALDTQLAVANFSNRGINGQGGEINIAAPGVDIYSAWPMPKRYHNISGTSMATPHVAGILALLWEKYPNHTANQIIQEMYTLALSLPLPKMDVGAGLVIAP